ncbi:MAG: metallophosphoesterase, partial [Muribaculaceae bacterium]|nr:metallophosphoesterase [Muribaculaceae bacterium]
MRISILMIIMLMVLQLLTDTYLTIIAIRRTRSRIWPRIQIWSAVVMLIYLIVCLLLPRRACDDNMLIVIMWMLFGYITVYISKVIFILIDLIASVPALWHRHRLQSISWIGAIASIVIFIGMWWGALINRFRIDIRPVTIEIADLPKSFDGFSIAQISDLHVGTYGNDTTYLADIVRTVNALHPDVICFTGDIVNRRSDELLPFTSVLSHFKAPYGVFSILGNHDYGDYSSWPSDQDKQANMQLMYDLQRNMGWKLLLNESVWVHNATDSIAVIGVENVGDPPFPVYGDIRSAYQNPDDNNIKILLSHNPFHWLNEICDNKDMNIALTLSGHTHAMQIQIAGISPAALRYKNWSGLYSDTA